MAHYLVKANASDENLVELKSRLDNGEIRAMRPFGKALAYSLANARVDAGGQIIWEEEDYCRPPLAMERGAVLDSYFTISSIEPVEAGDGWQQIDHLERLWS